MSDSVSVVIVTFNSAGQIGACLDSLLAQQGGPPDITVVDNASRDSTCEIAARYRGVNVLSLAENVGFSRANNIGAKHSTGEFLLFLNPDTVCPPDTINALVRAHRSEVACGLVGPRLVNADGSLQPSCRRFPTPTNRLAEALFMDRIPVPWFAGASYMMRDFAHDAEQVVEWLSGACLLTTRLNFERVGGFDEQFFLFSEDMDLGRRYQALGLVSVFTPEVSVQHLEGASTQVWSVTRGERELSARSLYYRKHFHESAVPWLLGLEALHHWIRWAAVGATAWRPKRRARVEYHRAMQRLAWELAHESSTADHAVPLSAGQRGQDWCAGEHPGSESDG